LQNEEAYLGEAVASTKVCGAKQQPQVIVVDGGSDDDTLKQAQACEGVLLLQMPHGGRGRQLNAGGAVLT
jgi:glycosyltransferase involved in cell wall biosynthesis